MNENYRGKCLTCEHWGGNANFMGGNIEQLRGATGKCYDKGSNNPNYYNGERLSSNDGCGSWKKHPKVN